MTPFSNKTAILSELWMNYRDDDEFIDFIEYNDLGLPLAYMLENAIVKALGPAEELVNETFTLLLAGVGVEDTGFETLDDVLEAADPYTDPEE